MFVRRLQNSPFFYLLVIILLISPAATPGYTWEVAADNHSLRNEAIAADCVSDNYVESAQYRWGKAPSRKDHPSSGPLAGVTPTAAVAQVLLHERNLYTQRVVNSSPRISEQILHHRTIVLLI